MPITVEISNAANLQRVKSLLGAKTESEAADLALEKVIEAYEPNISEAKSGDLPEAYWDELFSEPMLPSGTAIRAVLNDRDEAPY